MDLVSHHYLDAVEQTLAVEHLVAMTCEQSRFAMFYSVVFPLNGLITKKTLCPLLCLCRCVSENCCKGRPEKVGY